jgi:hypothetical protein
MNSIVIRTYSYGLTEVIVRYMFFGKPRFRTKIAEWLVHIAETLRWTIMLMWREQPTPFALSKIVNVHLQRYTWPFDTSTMLCSN